MNQDIYCGTFMELQELQPASHGFDPFNLAQASTNAAASYEMTGVAAGGDGALGGIAVAAEPAPAPTPVPGPDHTGEHEHKKRNLKDRYESMSACETPLEPSTLLPVPIPTKRKASSYGTPSAYDDDSEDVRSTRTAPDKKQNHSEIEKRRRDKMNTYISELSAMIPMCSAMSRKLDKLTVLRMAVQHLRTVRGAPAACPLSVNPRPAALSDRELNSLVLHAAQDTFLLVVGCDRGRLLYVSESVTSMLHYQQSELLGHSMFDILHPKDVAKVKEQLSSSDLSPRERLIDAKTMMPVQEVMGAGASRFCPGARRSFFCRIKCKSTSDLHRVKEDPECSGELHKKRSHEKKYRVVQCTGYLKSWAPAEVAEGGECDESGAGSLSCLVAVGRALPDLARDLSDPPRAPPFTRPMQFVSRHAIDGKYLFVDQRVTPALGFLAQELVGTSLYEHVSGRELAAVARAHKAALETRAPHRTPPYCVRRKDGSAALLQTLFKPFRNPWTKDMECLLAQNTLVSDARAGRVAADASTHAYAEGVSGMSVDGGSEGDAEVQRLIESRVESHKIGSAIAEEALRRNSAELSPLSLPPELLQDAFNTRPLLSDGEEGGGGGGGAAGPPGGEGEGEYPPDAGSPDGNGEAAIAVIMSLLEADAGLGGPVNYAGLPWPLP